MRNPEVFKYFPLIKGKELSGKVGEEMKKVLGERMGNFMVFTKKEMDGERKD